MKKMEGEKESKSPFFWIDNAKLILITNFNRVRGKLKIYGEELYTNTY